MVMMAAAVSEVEPDLSGISVLQFMTTTHFGFGASAGLPQLLEQIGSTRPLIVSDYGVERAGVLEQALNAVPCSDKLPSWLDTPPNPTEEAARLGAETYKHAGCDGVVAIGGGAALDLAKGIAIMATHDGTLWDFCNRHAKPRAIINPAPLIAMPTTSGSGSEVGRSAVIIFNNGVKAGVGCAGIVKAAICDPDLTLRLPTSVTAATGIDALSHCVETYSSPTVNPPADAIAIDGLRRALHHIERAVTHGSSDKHARWHMMMASLQGAVCFQKGMGAVHSLSHPIGALGYHHGTLNGIFLPAVLRYNRDALGVKYDIMRSCLPTELAGQDFADAIEALLTRIDLPTRLATLGIKQSDLTRIPEQALQDNAHKTNPRSLTAADYSHLIEQVFE